MAEAVCALEPVVGSGGAAVPPYKMYGVGTVHFDMVPKAGPAHTHLPTHTHPPPCVGEVENAGRAPPTVLSRARTLRSS